MKPAPMSRAPGLDRAAFVALGSNLGDSLSVIREALRRLQALSTEPLEVSSLWRTTPVDCPADAPLFVNAAARLRPRLDETPETLLGKLQALETELGRAPKRTFNEPRAIDLDLIAFGAETRATAFLTLPHPRARRRRFVLEPLNEIAPAFVLPGESLTVSGLLAGLRTAEACARIG